ncbi:MAG: NUDIX domain-containing protein [Spirochaetales bacterium]|nr:NUDIX domain-containing protein [Spirochaetales bacterium]
MPILDYQRNPFEGAIIIPESLPEDISIFPSLLDETLTVLRNEGIKVIWMNIPIASAGLVPTAVAAGFSYHHADENGLEMTLALREGAFIPPYATHYIGAGGVVIDDDRNILLITEKYNPKWKPHLKLPGGALNGREHISRAVCREVLEETGVRTEFMHLACMRHWHGYRYGKSDIYFVCRLKPLSKTISVDPEEIALAKWMPVDDYLKDPDTHPFNRKIVSSTLNENGLTRDFIEGYGTPETHELLFS